MADHTTLFYCLLNTMMAENQQSVSVILHTLSFTLHTPPNPIAELTDNADRTVAASRLQDRSSSLLFAILFVSVC